MKKKALYIISLATLCWSCTSDEQLSDIVSQDNTITADTTSRVQDSSDASEGVFAIMPNIEWGDSLSATRSTLVLNGSTMKFAWASGDQIGAYPILDDATKSTSQNLTYFRDVTGGTTKGEFGKNNYKFILSGAKDNKYAAYFPYKAANEGKYYTAIPVDYTGQTQTATAKVSYYVKSISSSETADAKAAAATVYNASEAAASAHLGAYDFMSNCATETSASLTTFNMQRLSAIARFYIVVPENVIFDELQVVNNSSSTGVFTTKGTVNISAESPSITATEHSNSLTLSFGTSGLDFSDASTNSPYYNSTKGKHMLVAYMMVAPVDLTTTDASGKTYLYLVGHTSTGAKKYYKITTPLSDKKFVAGKIYQWSTTDSDSDASISLYAISVEQWEAETININISTD